MPWLNLRYPGLSEPRDLLEEAKISITLKKKLLKFENCAYVSHQVIVYNYISSIENPILVICVNMCTS